MRPPIILAALALALGQVTPAQGQGQGPAQGRALDADHSGGITGDEWAAFGGASFAAADADRSGAVDAAEFTRFARTNWGGVPGTGDDDGPLFGLLDVNDDVRLVRDEWFEAGSLLGLDDDGSGALEGDEFVTGSGGGAAPGPGARPGGTSR